MLTREKYIKTRDRASEYLKKAGICITQEEFRNMEVAEYGLNDLSNIGLELIVYVNTERCCAKEMVMFPGQTCPEHRHPSVNGQEGKEETFRCRWGQVYLCIPGIHTEKRLSTVPESRKEYFTVFHEIVLNPGEQYTLSPNTLHWFQAGPQGAVISEFSTKSTDEFDIYSDPAIDPALKRKI